ncbi:MAG: hypothetical protein B6D41_02495 [Chloroflexi bacterium UTCFX4]|jgi:hypothetical protein|nr:MAG: hypothetical protein B6D41_02495 [Chloroflexi bacterium UTCFX4]
MFDLFLELLALANFLLAAALVIFTFALLLWLFPSSWRNPVQRGFSALLTFVGIVYIGQVFLLRATSPEAAEQLLRFKWIGIAFVPAAYLHFSNAVLRSTFYDSRWRRAATWAAYLGGMIFLGLVLLSDWIVAEPFNAPFATQLHAGPLFGLFAIYFTATTVWGIYNIELARRRTLTPISRRRLRRLGIAFIAPAFGVFPYLVFSGFPALIPPVILLLLTFFGTIALLGMLIVMAYTVAYQGALAPDRIIKQKFAHYLLRGPLVAVGVVTAMTIVPFIETLIPLSRDTLLAATVIIGVIVFEMLISRGKGYIDRVLFWQDRREINQIQKLEAHLLTTGDLRQVLENILAAMCDLLRVQSGFALAAEPDGWKLETVVGAREPVQQFMASQVAPPSLNSDETRQPRFFVVGEYWLYPLQVNGSDIVVGVLGVAARAPQPDLSEHEQELVDALASQAELALEDRALQKNVFDALEQIGSEVEALQRVQAKPRVIGGIAGERVEEELIASPDFNRAIKGALDDYWGGPKLAHSPLLQLNIVRQSLGAYGQNPTRALRGILAEAIDTLRPEGSRSLTAPEWLLYNILELKVMQGMKIREVAQKLAMSESDLYRKQRVAIQEVAKTVQQMEQRDQ